MGEKFSCGMSVALAAVVTLTALTFAEGGAKPEPAAEATGVHGFRVSDRRPSFWTKAATDLRESSAAKGAAFGRRGSSVKLQRRVDSAEEPKPETESTTTGPIAPLQKESNARQIGEEDSDAEEKIMNDESVAGLKKLADRVINETVRFFDGTRSHHKRSYNGEDQPQYAVWDDKDQTYQASTYSSSDYDPSLYHHHYLPAHSAHFYSPEKKDDTFFTKVAIIALLKLILAKVKAIGFLKILFLFFMKVPVFFFKFLFILKGFKLLKLFTVPVLIATVAAPLLPLIPLLAPLLLGPLLFIPLLLPLLIPLLFFLPIVPVTTPVTAAAATNRMRREALNTFNSPINSTYAEGKWGRSRNDTMFIRRRRRPSSYDSATKKLFEHRPEMNQNDGTEESTGLLELAQNVIGSQRCMERIACELARHNDSKIYRAAVIWALSRVESFASTGIKQKIERYREAYKNGAEWKSSDVCQSKFRCQRPRVLLLQGNSKYKVL